MFEYLILWGVIGAIIAFLISLGGPNVSVGQGMFLIFICGPAMWCLLLAVIILIAIVEGCGKFWEFLGRW